MKLGHWQTAIERCFEVIGVMSTIYERFGVRTGINASGSGTRIGGSRMPEQVIAAMAEAAKAFVRLEELQEAAGRVIADVTGAEAGYVSNGAAGGLMLATAACVVGMDPAKMDRLPDTTGMKDEVVVQRGHRNAYDHAIRAVGVKMVEVGYLGFPGAGITHPWEIEAAVTERTAAILWPVMDTKGTVPLPDAVRIGRKYGVPVIVDAAAALPPAENLRRFCAEGADIVVFSGGKALRGPQASGIVAGRADLIESIALQHQDMDVLPETWTHRQRYLESGILPGPPHHGIGRVCKVGKEEIVGLLIALQLYVEHDHEADYRQWERMAGYFASELESLPHVRVEVVVPAGRPTPQAHLCLDEGALGLSAVQVVNRLLEVDPMIFVNQGLMRDGVLIINPWMLEDGQEVEVVRALRVVLTGQRG
jgi:D-glucosaminate-6-phosphate ammonia-lyase